MMRRILSTAIAVVLLMSMAGVAQAARVSTWGDAVPEGTTDGNVQVGEGNSVASGGTIDAQGKLTGQVQTEVWLRSIASAQIDATVPLVVLVTMNVGGGDGIAPGDDYQIVNNGFVPLEVTKVAVDQNTVLSGVPGDQPVSLIPSIVGETDKDLLEAKIAFPVKSGNTETNLSSSKGTGSTTNFSNAGGDDNTIPAAEVVNGVNTPSKKTIGLDVATTPLSFITATKTNQNSTTVDGTFGDKGKGVCVFRIKYTLGATYTAIGETMTAPDLNGYDSSTNPNP